MATRRFGMILILGLVLSACATASPGPGAPAAGGAQSQAQSGATAGTRVQKTLRIAINHDTEGFVSPISGSAGSGSGSQQWGLVANRLQQVDEKGNDYAELAEALPSQANGTWKVNPDGTMVTTWKLRPNIKWHDGQPVTSDDVVFGYHIVTTPNVPTSTGVYTRNIADVVAVDPLTFTITWKAPYVDAARPAENLPVLPKHILESKVATTAAADIPKLAYFTDEYIGNGPYKIVSWSHGEQMDLAAFDDYYRGRAKIDRIIVRNVPDTNTQVASILSGDVDVILPTGVDVDTALTVKDRWAGTNNQVIFGSNGRLRMALAQSREAQANPKALLDARVRQALMRSMDPQAISDAISRGQATVADGVVPPFFDIIKDYQGSLITYPYDLAAAQRQFADAGWTKGADGALRNAQGQQFRLDIAGGQSARIDREMNSMSIGWKEIGIDPVLSPFPQSQVANEFRWDYQGIEIGGTTLDDVLTVRRSCNNIPDPSTQFRGNNRSGYCNQDYESLISRIAVTIDPTQRLELQREAVRFVMNDVSVMPMYWDLNPTLIAAGVTGIPAATQPYQMDTLRAYEWDIQR